MSNVARSLSSADRRRLHDYMQRLDEDIYYMIGYPMATDFDYQELYPLFRHLINNVGDPYIDPTHISHSKAMEREVIDFFADIFRAPQDDRWGHVTHGGTEGNLHALYLARRLYPTAITYYSKASHYSIAKALDMLRMPSVAIDILPSHEMDYDDLERHLRLHADLPAIVIANIGTTFSEARDNLVPIRQKLSLAGSGEYFIHCDAAFSGIPSALLDPRHPFDFADGADSILITQKFIGTPMPCGIILTKRSHHDHRLKTIEYIGTADSTVAGSRNGHVPIMLWYAIKKWGVEGFKKRAKDSLALAKHLERRLKAMGWPAWRNPQATTVVLASPPKAIIKKWQLATERGSSHIICAPGVTYEQINGLLADIERHVKKTAAGPVPATATTKDRV